MSERILAKREQLIWEGCSRYMRTQLKTKMATSAILGVTDEGGGGEMIAFSTCAASNAKQDHSSVSSIIGIGR